MEIWNEMTATATAMVTHVFHIQHTVNTHSLTHAQYPVDALNSILQQVHHHHNHQNAIIMAVVVKVVAVLTCITRSK